MIILLKIHLCQWSCGCKNGGREKETDVVMASNTADVVALLLFMTVKNKAQE